MKKLLLLFSMLLLISCAKVEKVDHLAFNVDEYNTLDEIGTRDDIILVVDLNKAGQLLDHTYTKKDEWLYNFFSNNNSFIILKGNNQNYICKTYISDEKRLQKDIDLLDLTNIYNLDKYNIDYFLKQEKIYKEDIDKQALVKGNNITLICYNNKRGT